MCIHMYVSRHAWFMYVFCMLLCMCTVYMYVCTHYVCLCCVYIHMQCMLCIGKYCMIGLCMLLLCICVYVVCGVLGMYVVMHVCVYCAHVVFFVCLY